jgi:hypothetical protein
MAIRSRPHQSQSVQTAKPRSRAVDTDASGFTARAPRLSFRTPVGFQFEEREIKGYSVNISESGMLAVFDRQLDVLTTGRLSAAIGECHITTVARVVRIKGCEAALAFQRMNEDARALIQRFIEYEQPGGCFVSKSG